jgi:2-hydroxy-3-keto-5-methylthiopentenyl-1-phosphate phosphatase
VRLVVDFDGTVTVEDTLVMVIGEFGDREVYEQAAAALARGEITLQEEIRRDCEPITAPLHEVVPWLVEHADVRPGFREFALANRPLIVSSNFHELIEPILRREGVELEVHANRLDARPDGWRTIFRNTDECGTCGEPCKRRDLPRGEVVYVGDGYSDRCAALAAGRVFARDGLAAYLGEQGAPFEPFDDFRDVAAAFSGPSAR